ncbi:hypothetical protein LSH36_44g09004 [Paralvinella palmiformis]|uniref:Uncharacterized protein n=1 Tax=Paralvinella palmiformis TaxID=53620 RepID=A0AAD9K7G5_9ANNE|nr:hypothetical protein LSH36_44g09004 [Paralvinella palmiformis]
MSSVCVFWILLCGVTGCLGIRLDENSTTVRIWAHFKSKGGSLLLERPGESKGKPDLVTISLSVQHVRAVDEAQMGIAFQELSFDAFLRYHWLDERTAYGEGPAMITLPMRLAKDQIWLPDLFVVNAHDVSLHETLDTNSGVFITRDGKVTVSSRLAITTHCYMNLKKYPHDRHVCGLSIESYMFTNQSIKLQWGSITFSSDASPTAFKLSFRNKTVNTSVLNGGIYETAEVTVNLVRINGHYTVLLYAPSIVLILLSMLLYWLPLSALLERTLLGAILLFSLTGTLIGTQYGSPQVGYTKAIDVWVLGCFVFVAASLFEVIVLHLIFRRGLLTKPGDQFELMASTVSTHFFSDGITREGEPPKEVIGKTFGSWYIRPDVAHKVDVSLRVLYPVMFGLFNAIYWGMCTA